jgi:F-type H+-transporting ATPase subunit gamma
MATLRDIRRQLHSIGNIRKITQAMEVVAASRLRKAQAHAEQARPYFNKLTEIMDNLVRGSEVGSDPLTQVREVQKQGFVVIAGDKGLCGAYNQMIFTTTEKLIKNLSPENVKLFLVGNRAIDYFAYKKWKRGKPTADWGGKITYAQIHELTQHLTQQFLEGQVDEIWLVYTHFVNVAVRQIRVEKLFPIEPPKRGVEAPPIPYQLEPGPQEIFKALLPHYSVTKVQAALNDAYASELAARIFSMRAATKNSDELIQKLTLVRNKIRQTGITKELIEITSGAESLKQG